jgi:hypothetical protein
MMMKNKKRLPRGTSTTRATPKEVRSNTMASTMEDMVLVRVHLIKELVGTTKRINRTSTRIHIIKEEGSSMVGVKVDITSSRRILDTIANRIEGNNMLPRVMDLR